MLNYQRVSLILWQPNLEWDGNFCYILSFFETEHRSTKKPRTASRREIKEDTDGPHHLRQPDKARDIQWIG